MAGVRGLVALLGKGEIGQGFWLFKHASVDKELCSGSPESNVHENIGTKWKDQQTDNDRRETGENW